MTATTPLLWPIGRRRNPQPRPSPFGVTGPRAMEHLRDQVRLIGGRNLVVSTNLPLTRYTAEPRWSERAPKDPGVAVYFDLDGEEVCFACDRWTLVADNLRAIGKTIENLRGIERWGTEDMVRASFTGFAALPARSITGWWDVLGVEPTASPGEIDAAYRRLVMERHPDRGGDHDAFLALQDAYQAATADRRVA